MALMLKEALNKEAICCPRKPEQRVLPNEERIAIAKKAVEQALGRELQAPEYEIVGSTYIKDSTDSDVDVLVLDESQFLDEAVFPGWEYGGSVGEGNDSSWGSWKKHVDGVDVNLLLTVNRGYFHSWLTAVEVCRFLHLQGYDIRTATVHGIHEIVMEDTLAEDENKNRSC